MPLPAPPTKPWTTVDQVRRYELAWRNYLESLLGRLEHEGMLGKCPTLEDLRQLDFSLGSWHTAVLQIRATYAVRGQREPTVGGGDRFFERADALARYFHYNKGCYCDHLTPLQREGMRLD